MAKMGVESDNSLNLRQSGIDIDEMLQVDLVINGGWVEHKT